MTPSTIRPLRGVLIGICLLVAAGANLSSTERESSRRPSRLASLRTTRHARLSTVIRPLRRKRAAVGSSDVSALARSAGDACSASSDRCRSRTRAGASLIRVETAAVPGAGKEAARKRKRAVFPLAETMIEEAVNGRQRGAGFDGWRHLGVIDKAANRVIRTRGLPETAEVPLPFADAELSDPSGGWWFFPYRQARNPGGLERHSPMLSLAAREPAAHKRSAVPCRTGRRRCWPSSNWSPGRRWRPIRCPRWRHGPSWSIPGEARPGPRAFRRQAAARSRGLRPAPR
jgi:hypothetical protein